MDPDLARIRILVVDDHTLFRRGLTALLQRDPQFEVVGDAGDARRSRSAAPRNCSPT
jgi:two-component system nitrate/nitrite response regulator NarL